MSKRPNKFSSMNPRPFLKWAGGKRQLIPQMKKYLPREFNNYIEPLVGGGALFFYLLPKKAILIDINDDLINCYKVIKNNVYELIELLKNHVNEKGYYYRMRKIDRNPEKYNKLSEVEKASRIIFLNRCCYNGLYRVNSKGQFNVPFGKYKNPKFCDKDNLIAVHKVLQQVELVNDSFEKCLNFAEEGDFIYLDPPYQPISETANFTSYTKENFGVNAQNKLFDIFTKLNDIGCKVVLSNSYNKFTLDLYQNYEIVFLEAKRAINSNAKKRGAIKEILVLN